LSRQVSWRWKITKHFIVVPQRAIFMNVYNRAFHCTHEVTGSTDSISAHQFDKFARLSIRAGTKKVLLLRTIDGMMAISEFNQVNGI
jgi:hypothetical protein